MLENRAYRFVCSGNALEYIGTKLSMQKIQESSTRSSKGRMRLTDVLSISGEVLLFLQLFIIETL